MKKIGENSTISELVIYIIIKFVIRIARKKYYLWEKMGKNDLHYKEMKANE